MEQEILIRKSFVFTLDIIQYYELLGQQKNNVVAQQLLIKGTSFGEKMHEVQYAKNETDYINIIKKVASSAQKTKYWLQLCKYSKSFPNTNNLITNLEELIELISESTFKLHLNN